MYQELLENGADPAENIEDFNEMIEAEITKREQVILDGQTDGEPANPEDVASAARTVLAESSASHMR